MEGYPDQRDLVTRRATNITTVGHGVPSEARAQRNGHHGGILWFTGLSGAGKSTLALALEARLFAKGYHVYVLDGDNIRDGLNANLGFSPEDRAENIRRVGEVASLFADAGFLVISSFISPYRVGSRARAPGGAGRLPRDLHPRLARGLRGARSQGPVPARAGRRDPRVHRHQLALRGARQPAADDPHRPAHGRGLPERAGRLRRAELRHHLTGPDPCHHPRSPMPSACCPRS